MSNEPEGSGLMDADDETRALRGLNRTLDRLHRPRLGWLEVAIVVAIIVLLIAAFLSMAYVFQQAAQQASRDRSQAARDAELADLAQNVRTVLLEVRAIIKGLPEGQRKMLQGIEALLERQTQVIVREQKQRTVVVVISPQPQPTATVTCDPTPVLGDCRRPRK